MIVVKNKKYWTMKYLAILLFMILLGVVLVGGGDDKGVKTEIVSPFIEKTTLVNGRVGLAITSVPAYVKEDGSWKTIKEARSLVGSGWEVKFIEQDPDFIIKVLDYNYTSITVDLSTSSKQLDKDIPIKVLEVDTSQVRNATTPATYKTVVSDTSNFKAVGDKSTKTYSFGLGKVLEYGFNSTELTLTANNTMVQETYLCGYPGAENKDESICTDMRASNDLYGNNRWVGLINWTIDEVTTGIPSTAVVSFAELNLTPNLGADSNIATTSGDIYMYRMKQLGWVEGTKCDAACTDGASYNKYDCANSLSWQTAGAFGANDYDSTEIDTYNWAAIPDVFSFHSANFKSLIQSVIAGTYQSLNIQFSNPNAGGGGFAPYTIDSGSNFATLYIEYGTPTAPTITFNFQDPPDLTSNNIINTPMNVSYNITGMASVDDLAFFWLLNGSRSIDPTDNLIYVNGTWLTGWQEVSASTIGDSGARRTNDSDSYYIRVNEWMTYPGTYNIKPENFENTPSLPFALNNINTYAKIELLNVSNITQYSFFEFNASVSGTGSLRVYTCNSTYTTGSPITSLSCNQFASVQSTDVVNHTHSQYSGHYVISYAINSSSGTIGTVAITDSMQFLLRGDTVANWFVGYINNDSRAGAAQTTTNNGGAWTTQAYTFDAHLHQWGINTPEPVNATFNYYIEANNTAGMTQSPIRSDKVDLAGMPPTVTVEVPTNTTYSGVISISWTAESPNVYPIIDQNITLLNDDTTTNMTIASNVSSPYDWNTTGIIIAGDFRVQIDVMDNESQTAFDRSALFHIDNINYPQISVGDTTLPINFGSYDLSINASDVETPLNQLTYSWTNGNTSVVTANIGDNTTGVMTFTSLANASGTSQISITVSDLDNNQNTTTFNLIIPFSYQQPWVDGTLPSVDVPENTGSFIAWLWSVITSIWHDVTDLVPSTVEITSQTNNSVADCSVDSISIYFDDFTDANNNKWFFGMKPAGTGTVVFGYEGTYMNITSGDSSQIVYNATDLSTLGDDVYISFYVKTWEGFSGGGANIGLSENPDPTWDNTTNNFYEFPSVTQPDFSDVNFEIWYNSSTMAYAIRNSTSAAADTVIGNLSVGKYLSIVFGANFNFMMDNITITQGNTGGAVNITCVTGANATGINQITVNMSNAGGLSVTTTGEVNVTHSNQAPWFDPIGNTSSIDENSALNNVSLQIPWQDSWHDVEDTSPYSSALSSNNSDLSCSIIDGYISCSALNNMTGAGSLNIQANDSEGGSAYVNFDLIVNSINQPPWIDQLDNVTIEEDSCITACYLYDGAALNNSFRDVEFDQKPVNTTVYSQDNETVAECYIGDADGNLYCTTQANMSGQTTITLQFLDSNSTSVNELITLFVTEVNDAPIIEWDALTPTGGNFSTDQPFYFNVTDPDSGAVVNNCTLYRDSAYSNMTGTTVLGVDTNFIMYPMNSSEGGIYSFAMECMDSEGNISSRTTAKVVAFDNILPTNSFVSPASDNTTVLSFFTPGGSVTLSLAINVTDTILNSTNITIWKDDGTQVFNNYTQDIQVTNFMTDGDVTITQGNGTYYLEVKSWDYALNDPAEIVQFDVLDESSEQDHTEFVNTTQLPTKTYYYELNLTYNPAFTVSATLNISDSTYSLSSEDNGTAARFYNNIYTPLSREGKTNQPYNWYVTYTFPNGTTIINDTIGGTINYDVLDLNLCNDTVTTSIYLDFNFKDETNLSVMGALIADGSYVDYTLDPARAEEKRIYYTNITQTNDGYPFCFNLGGETLYTNPFLLYYSNGYAQRTYQALTTISTVDNVTLYLVANGIASYITFNTYNPAGSPLANVLVVSERQIGGVWTTVETKYTDTAGVVLFLVDVNSPYRMTFTKNGYQDQTYTPSIPIQTASAYTIIMATTPTSSTNSYVSGVQYTISPPNVTLTNETDYNFSLDIKSEYFTNIEEAGFWLGNESGNLTNPITCTGDISCSASTVLNTENNTYITMYYYWRVNGTVVSPLYSKTWWVSHGGAGSASIARFVDDLNNLQYRWNPEDRSKFSFTTALLAFFITLLATGALSYVSGIYSPAALLMFATGCFWFFAAIGMLPVIGFWWTIPAVITIVVVSYYAFETIRI